MMPARTNEEAVAREALQMLPKNIRPKSSRTLDREISEALAGPSRGHVRTGALLSWEGKRVPIDPTPRTIKPFELSRPYVVRHGGRLYTIVLDTQRGEQVAHPAVVEGRASHATKRSGGKRASHATTKASDKTSDKISIAQLATMFGLPDWDRIDEMNQQHYWEMAKGADDEEAAEQEAQTEVYNRWYDAVESTAEKLLAEHGLELLAMKHTRKVHANYRPHVLKIIATTSWSDAADKLRETINGVGDFHFDNLREFLDSGPYTAKQAVLSHLGYIKRHPAVYGGLGANQMYEHAWR
jgi:hypothetical protein